MLDLIMIVPYSENFYILVWRLKEHNPKTLVIIGEKLPLYYLWFYILTTQELTALVAAKM